MTSNYALRLCEDARPSDGRLALPPRARVIYVKRGGGVVASAGRDSRVAEDQAWQGAVACSVTAGSGGAPLWRGGAVPRGRPAPGGAHPPDAGVGRERPRPPP